MENTSLEYNQAYEKALNLIKIRPHGSGELEKKLRMRRFNAGIIREVTEKLKQQGLINDRQFQEAFMDSLIRLKTYGYYGILAKLLSRGINKTEAEGLLREFFPIEVEKEVAMKVVLKEKGQDKVRLAQKLSRKGFRNEVITSVIREEIYD